MGLYKTVQLFRKNKNTSNSLFIKVCEVFHECRRSESNRYGKLIPQDFKSWASASSATAAYAILYGYGTNRARTYDPLLVRQVLSQLSYDPKSYSIIAFPKVMSTFFHANDPDGTRTHDLRRDRAAL